MDELISRQAVLDEINRIGVKGFETYNDYSQLYDYVDTLSPIKPQEPKIGHWEWQTEDIYRCSECSEDIHVKEVMNVPQYEWCPMCGTKMEVEE